MNKKEIVQDLRKRILNRYLRLKIVHKLLLGYLPLTALTIFTAFFALLSLEKLNSLNKSIIKNDIPLIKATEKMIESLYSQELYGNRYVILKSKGMMELFLDGSKEFKSQLRQIKSILEKKGIKIEKISHLHDKHDNLFFKWFKNLDNPSDNQKDYGSLINDLQNELISLIRDVYQKAGIDLNEKTITTSNIGIMAFRITGALCILSFIIGIGAAILITRNISKAIAGLKQATGEISKGNFDHVPGIRNQDELGDLSNSFKEMGVRLKRLEEMYRDASPLTHLPGGIAIENILKKRIDSGQQIAFCLIDLDNFKVYNDYYGYSKGNDVIKSTAKIIEDSVSKKGSNGNFIGHIGGDDFVIISPVAQYSEICSYIVKVFDKKVANFYDSGDIFKGYITGKTRKGRRKKFPLMNISIAVVTNKDSKNMHYVQFGEKAAELKEYAKSIPKSLFVEERRKITVKK